MKTIYRPFALVLALLLVLPACDILEVDNPNNLVEDDLANPAAASAMANGVEASVTRALGAILAPYSTATDELTWVGSRDAWQQLDFGNVNNPLNEFTDAAFPYVGEARWLADEFIDRLEAFKADGALRDDTPLARSYLYGAIIYVTIADMFDDFTFSDRREAAPPVGPANMGQLYDTAIGYLDQGLALNPSGELQTALLGMRARAKYSKALWQKLNPNPNTGDPLINDAGAVADAQAALASSNEPDWRYELVLDPSSPNLVVGDLSMALQVNNRLELRIGGTYIQPTDDGKKVEAVTLQDPIDGVVQPFLESEITAFTDARQYADITVVSAREMRLIIAEAALAQGNTGTFAEQINAIRTLDGLTAFSGQIDAREMLIHARQVYLFLQGRRLADLYRFGLRSSEWTSDGVAVQQPGTFLPITIIEIRANPHLG
ncbi:MAG: hypothetical protein R3247_06010 [Rhodothermales bacterium]|nr:hypothetical protein [Rhodothermales bacterium]